MVDRTNGQSQSIAEAEAQVGTLESQIQSSQSQLGIQEQQLRSSFIPGTVESQFRLGSAQALRQARSGLAIQKREGLEDISLQRGQLQTSREQLRQRRAEIARVKAEKAAADAARKERERQIRIAKVERKLSIDKAIEERDEVQGFQSIPLATQSVPIFQLQSLAPIQTEQVQTLASPSDLAPIKIEPLQSFASPSDLGITPKISSPSSFFKTQEQIGLPARTGGVLPITEEGFTAQSFVSGPQRGKIISQFTAPTRDPFVSPFLGPSQEFLERRRATQLEAERVASFVVGPGRSPQLTDAGFETGLGDIRRGAITQARDEFSALPEGRKARATFASFAQVPTRLGATGTQFTFELLGALGQQTPGQKRRVELGEQTLFGRALQAPFLRPSNDLIGKVGPQAFATGALLIPTAAISGKQFVRQVRLPVSEGGGFKQVGAEAVSTFSPLSLKSGPLIPKTTPSTQLEGFGIVSGKGDKVRRDLFFKGVKDPVEVRVIQESIGIGPTKTISAQQTETTVPVISIFGGGGFVKSGFRTTLSDTLGIGVGTKGKVVKKIIKGPDTDLKIIEQEGLQFGIVDTLTKPSRDLFLFEGGQGFGTIGSTTGIKLRGGGVSRKIPDTPITQFIAGPRTGILGPSEFDPGLATITQRTTRARVKPTVSGFEIDLRKSLVSEDISGLGGAIRKVKKSTVQETQLIDPNLGSAIQAARGALAPRPVPKPSIKVTKIATPTLEIIGLEARRIGDLPTIVGGRGLAPPSSLNIPRQSSLISIEPSSGPLSFTPPRPTGRTVGQFDLGTGIKQKDLLGLGLGIASAQIPLSKSRTGLATVQLGLQTQASSLRQFQPSSQVQSQVQRTAQRFGSPLIAEVATSTGRPSATARPFRPVAGFGFPLPIPTLGGFGVPSRKPIGKRKPGRVAPSFTAGVLDLTGTEELTFDPKIGISPFEIRRKKVKKKKKTANKKKTSKKKKKK